MESTVQPSAVEAERAILGAILLSSDAVNLAGDILTAEDFYRDSHRIVFESILELSARATGIDLVTLSRHLEDRGELERVGGKAALAEMAAETGTAANVESHSRLVKDKARLRRLLAATERIRTNIHTSAAPASEVIDEAEHEIFMASNRESANEPRAFSAATTKTFERIEEFRNYRGGLTGLTTGYPDLDRMTAGWQKSDLVILAGRPSMGKTSLAVNVMEAAAMGTKQPVVFFSMEMGMESVVMRFLCANARVPFARVRGGRAGVDEVTELVKAADRLSRTRLFIDDSSVLTPMEVRSRCRRIVAQHGPLGLVVIDYLQLMHSSRRIENRVQEVSEISRTLKAVARELDCPVIALSQLSRAPAQRSDARPQLSDLRDSGAIEQDADIVAFIHREGYAGAGGEGGDGTAELLVRKHRNGETGTVRLVFIAELMRFESAAEGDEGDTTIIT